MRYVIDGTEPANAIIDITIPWDDIKDFPVMDDLPMYYTLTHADFRNLRNQFAQPSMFSWKQSHTLIRNSRLVP